MSKRKFGWLKDDGDRRDLEFIRPKLTEYNTVRLGDKFKLPPILNQSNLGSCVEHGVAEAVRFNFLNGHSQSTLTDFLLSRLWLYYEARKAIHTINWDSGSQIRDAIKVLANLGVPDEKLWSYDISKFTKKPPQATYKAALEYQSIEYRYIDNQDKGNIIQALNEGYPVIFGFWVFPSFDTLEVEKTGNIPMPKTSEGRSIGGHCMLADSYDATTKRFGGPNSYGEKWGSNGRFTIPDTYLTDLDLADDFWIITLME